MVLVAEGSVVVAVTSLIEGIRVVIVSVVEGMVSLVVSSVVVVSSMTDGMVVGVVLFVVLGMVVVDFASVVEGAGVLVVPSVVEGRMMVLVVLVGVVVFISGRFDCITIEWYCFHMQAPLIVPSVSKTIPKKPKQINASYTLVLSFVPELSLGRGLNLILFRF